MFFKLKCLNAWNNILKDRVIYGTTIHVIDADNNINYSALAKANFKEDTESQTLKETEKRQWILHPDFWLLKYWFLLIFCNSLAMITMAPYYLAFYCENDNTYGYGIFYSIIC